MNLSRSPLMFDGEKCEVVLTPTRQQLDEMANTAYKLMSLKMQDWILDQLTIEQLENCIEIFKAELDKRRGPTETRREGAE